MMTWLSAGVKGSRRVVKTETAAITRKAPLAPNEPPEQRGSRAYRVRLHYRTRAATHRVPSIWANRLSDQPRSSTRRCHSAPSRVAASRSRHSR